MTEVCLQCEGNGWVEDLTDSQGNTFMRPCALCRPALHDRWRAGHLEPGHTCEECQTRKPLRSAPKPFKVETSNEAPDAIPIEAF